MKRLIQTGLVLLLTVLVVVAIRLLAGLPFPDGRLGQGLSAPKRPVIGLLSWLPLAGAIDPHGRQVTPPWQVLEEIRQRFQVELVPGSVEQVPDEIAVLLLVHPKGLSEPSLYAIDQFVLRGGKLLLFVDPLSEADTGLGPDLPPDAGRASDLEPLLEAWGLRLVPDQVLADGTYAMGMGLGRGLAPALPEDWLGLPRAALDPRDASTQGLAYLSLASAGLLEPLVGASTRFMPVLRSSANAMPFAATGIAALREPLGLSRELKPTGERYSLAARIRGPARSAYPEGIEGRREGLKAADSIHLLVVADTDLLSDPLWVQAQGLRAETVRQPWADNGRFVINALNSLVRSNAPPAVARLR
ncbi:MAG: Gldg family protein [Pseudomonas sp.]|uniref:Gldg family protein n=1 Tax=Pseudomonas sp. TaxID=306 RepID=UPI003392D1DE